MNEKEIKCGGFGSHNQYEMNMARNRRNNFEIWCEHCAKAMGENVGWLVRWHWIKDSLVPFTEEQADTFVKRVGNECIKKFLSTKEEYEIFAERVSEI